MASRAIKDLTICSICLETFRDPRLLECQHTFCRRCLQDMYSQVTEERIQCPICRQASNVPIGGVGSFPKNFTMIATLDALIQLEPGDRLPSPSLSKFSKLPSYTTSLRSVSNSQNACNLHQRMVKHRGQLQLQGIV